MEVKSDEIEIGNPGEGETQCMQMPTRAPVSFPPDNLHRGIINSQEDQRPRELMEELMPAPFHDPSMSYHTSSPLKYDYVIFNCEVNKYKQ